MKNLYVITVLAGLALLTYACPVSPPTTLTTTTTIDSDTLLSKFVSSSPIVDGSSGDSVWASAPALNISLDNRPYTPSNGYPGMLSSDVTIKSVYTSSKIYFLIQWTDPSESVERFPWQKDATGWYQLSNKDNTGHENTYYEDKFALLWDINTANFQTNGCAIACHMNVDPPNPGRKYTNSALETIDMWHWKGVRTGPIGQIDDQFINSNTDATVNKDWGRKGDDKIGGGYSDNKSGSLPLYMDPTDGKIVNNKYWITDSEKVAFVDSFSVGEQIAAIVVNAFTGSRGDITAQGAWSSGQWTLEFVRDLVTTGSNAATQDVQFNNLTGIYYFGLAAFDNSQINHVFHWGAKKMVFEQ